MFLPYSCNKIFPKGGPVYLPSFPLALSLPPICSLLVDTDTILICQASNLNRIAPQFNTYGTCQNSKMESYCFHLDKHLDLLHAENKIDKLALDSIWCSIISVVLSFELKPFVCQAYSTSFKS